LSWLAFRLYGDPNSKRDFVAEALTDTKEKVKEYIEGRKGKPIGVVELATDLNISVGGARRIYSDVWKSLPA
jgi:hypothetical protein